jgi:hypothetical protein
MTDEELDDLDAQMEHLLDGVSPWPWRTVLEHGIPMIYANEEAHAVGFTIYGDEPTEDSSPQADANSEIQKKAPELAAKVQELIKVIREERKAR